MASKTKAKPKSKQPVKAAGKSRKPAAKAAPKAAPKKAAKPAPKSKSRPAPPAKKAAKARSLKSINQGKLPQAVNKIKPMVAQKPPVRPISGAVQALEDGIKLMYAEKYDKAIKSFKSLIVSFPDEVEIQASARAHIQACEKKTNEKARTSIRSADDHYHMAVAFLNGGQLDSAMTHLQQALKLEPKGGHILYAIAAANALKGNKEQALSFLKQSIHHGPENRFHAAQDHDFATLVEEQAFKELLTPPGK